MGEEKPNADGERRHRERRWVVEPTLAWLSRCRGLLVQYERESANDLGLSQGACALLRYRRTATLSQPGYVR